MPYNGSGVFMLVAGNPVVTGTIISSTWANNTLSDIANNGLSNALTKDGQQTPTGNIKLGGFQLTGLGNATTRDAAPNAGQIQDGALVTLSSVAGTDTITASSAPAITAYATGQSFQFVSSGSNTTNAVTLNINALGAKPVMKIGPAGLVQLSPSDFQTGQEVTVFYDGTQFQVVSRTAMTSAYAFRNKLINGNFRVWQVATSFALPAATPTYTADQWQITAGSGGAATVTQQSVAASVDSSLSQSSFFLRYAQTTPAVSAPSMGQPMLGVRQMAGKLVQLSVTASVPSGTLVITPKLTQQFGAGGSTQVDTAVPPITIDTTLRTQTVSVFLPTLAGKTIGSVNTDSLILVFLFPTALTYNVDFYQIQVEEMVVTPFENRAPTLETQLAQYFYETTQIFVGAAYPTASSAQAIQSIKYSVAKRAVPTVNVLATLFTNNVASAVVSNINGFSSEITVTQGPSAGNFSAGFNFSIDARF